MGTPKSPLSSRSIFQLKFSSNVRYGIMRIYKHGPNVTRLTPIITRIFDKLKYRLT
jgi:hypothetical protein